ncbi:AI-2E family transporter [Patescibacteria group bacterium]|nr:AI-2E family transporter [Patescibacteria group bacterium]
MAKSTSTRSYITKHSALFVLLSLGAGAWLAYKLRDLIVLLFLTLIVVLALRPIVDWCDRRGVNRRLASFGVIILLLAALIGGVFSVMPELIEQGKQFASQVPQYLSQFAATTHIELPSLADAIEKVSGTGVDLAINVTSATFGALFSIFAVVTVGYYGLAEYSQIWKGVGRLPIKPVTTKAIQANVEQRLGGWVRGQAILSILVGILEFITYLLFGIPFAGLLAIVGALFAIVPVIGPIAAAVPVLLVALTISTGKAIWVGVAYLGIQLVVAYLFTPKILGKAAGLHPASVIIALIAGSALGGIIGILLAIPVLVFLIAIYEGVSGRDAPLTT